MKIIAEGRKHEHIAYYTTCDICESELRILEGDPYSTQQECFNVNRNQYWIRYICPVCFSQQIAMTDSIFGTLKANSKRKLIILNKEDRKELIKNMNVDPKDVLDKTDLEWVNNRTAP